MAEPDTPPLVCVRVPDGQGGTRLELRPLPPPPPRADRRRKPDPIRAGSTSTARTLASLIERRERLADERAEIDAQISEVNAEAKALGFDVTIINLILRQRRADPQDLAETEALLDTYRAALGLIEEGERT